TSRSACRRGSPTRGTTAGPRARRSPGWPSTAARSPWTRPTGSPPWTSSSREGTASPPSRRAPTSSAGRRTSRTSCATSGRTPTSAPPRTASTACDPGRSCAGAGLGGEADRRGETGLGVGRGHGAGDGGRVLALHAGEDAATEAASGHPGAVRPRREGGPHRGVHLGDGDLEVVAHGGVRGGQQRADVARVRPGPEHADHLLDPVVLGDDVPDPTPQEVLVEAPHRGVEVGDGDVAQGGHPELLRPPGAGAVPLGV